MNYNDQDFEKTEEELWGRFSRTEGIDRAEISIELVEVVLEKDRFVEALALCELVEEIYEANPDLVEDADLPILYERKALSLKGLGRMGEGAQYAQKAAVLSEERDASIGAGLYRLASLLWYHAHDWARTIECSMKASQMLYPENDMFLIGQDFFNIGISHYNLEQYELAIQNLQISRRDFKEIERPTGIAYCDEELAKCYLKLEDRVGSEKHATLALDYANITCENERQSISNFLFGLAKKLAGEYDEAEKYLEIAKYMLTIAGPKNWNAIIDTEEALAEVYRLTGKSQEAAEILRRIESVRSSLEGAEKSKDPKPDRTGEYVQLALDFEVVYE